MFWYGQPLTGIQRLSMRSFLHFGHDVTLFVYQNVQAPDGVLIRDANEILPKEQLFVSHDTYAAFSDVFRYELLTKEAFIWADADTVCLKPNWDFGEYIFGFQEPFKLGNAILGYPQDSMLAKSLKSEGIYQEGKTYDAIGPVLLTRLVSELGLGNKVQPQHIFNPIDWTQFGVTYDPANLDYVLRKCQDSYTVSLSNYLLKYHNFDRDNFPAGSAVAYWDELFK